MRSLAFIHGYSAARVERQGDVYELTGHVAGELLEPRTYLGPDARYRAMRAARVVAFEQRLPERVSSRSGRTSVGLQPVIVRAGK